MVSIFPVLEASVASSTNTTTKSPFILACIYEGAVKRLDFMCSSKGRQQTLRFHACLLRRKVHLFLHYLKKYKNFEHSSLELFYSVIYFIHKGGMTNVKRKNKISIKSISS